MQTSLGIDTGEPNHERLREHSADFTPLPVVTQMLEFIWGGMGGMAAAGCDTFIQSQGAFMLDPAAGGGVFGQAMGLHPGFAKWTRSGVEIRAEEKAAERHYDNLRLGDALAADTLAWYARYDLIMTNPPFHLWKEYVRTFLPLLRSGGVLALLGLCSWGQRSAAGVELFTEHRPAIQARITGTIGFRGPGINPKTGNKWGSDPRDYCWWVWVNLGDSPIDVWASLNLPLLPAMDRRWRERPGTQEAA